MKNLSFCNVESLFPFCINQIVWETVVYPIKENAHIKNILNLQMLHDSWKALKGNKKFDINDK